ncbi:39S ribosomal protein L16, mitochondrial-like [Oppia nitens]|uniref:39S ribosomal protein L16, mitochondrial-like n=1 Tax=Oppia nitens TaxID=1686743 RepID=UPI0023D99A7A|nr:39S ribosomal protein L16, mitochondrial-like [Oppia nitens]
MLTTLTTKFRLNVCLLTLNSIRGRKWWPIPPDLRHIELPPEHERQLIALEPTPDWHGVRPRKFTKQRHDIMGPEVVNNQLIHRQYGIIALTGYHITINHINLIRTVINKHMDINKAFAIWRIEAPWKPISKRSQGKRMGGGKAAIHHYATPIRAGQVIVEIGGRIEFDECYYYLESISKRLPCDAYPVSQEILDHWDKEEEELKQKNINPISFERVVKLNLQGSHQWIKPYDKLWYGKYTSG